MTTVTDNGHCSKKNTEKLSWVMSFTHCWARTRNAMLPGNTMDVLTFQICEPCAHRSEVLSLLLVHFWLTIVSAFYKQYAQALFHCVSQTFTHSTQKHCTISSPHPQTALCKDPDSSFMIIITSIWENARIKSAGVLNGQPEIILTRQFTPAFFF